MVQVYKTKQSEIGIKQQQAEGEIIRIKGNSSNSEYSRKTTQSGRDTSTLEVWAFIGMIWYWLVSCLKAGEARRAKLNSGYTKDDAGKIRQTPNEIVNLENEIRETNTKNGDNRGHQEIKRNDKIMEVFGDTTRECAETPKETQNHSADLTNGLPEENIKCGDNDGHQILEPYEKKIKVFDKSTQKYVGDMSIHKTTNNSRESCKGGSEIENTANKANSEKKETNNPVGTDMNIQVKQMGKHNETETQPKHE